MTTSDIFSNYYNYFGYLKGANEVNRQYFQKAVLLCLLKAEYAPMLHVSYYAQNYAGKICQGLGGGGELYTTAMDTIICLYS